MNQPNLAFRIKKIMENKKLNQKDFSDILGISQPAVSLYLKGRMPPADVLYRIATLGDSTVEWLLTGEEKKIDRGVHEQHPAYGNQYLLLKLWEQLPSNIQKTILILLKQVIENK